MSSLVGYQQLNPFLRRIQRKPAAEQPPDWSPQVSLVLSSSLLLSLHVLSNGRYKSVHHRAVTNKVEPRLSLAMFYGPNKDTVIGPNEDLIDEEHPPLYRSHKYAEFFEEFYKQEAKKKIGEGSF